MEEFVAYIIKNLVSVPEGVNVSSCEEGEKLKIEIRVDQEDVGKIIGRKGNTINALRTIVRTVATRLGRKVQVELIQADKPEEDSIVETAEPEEVALEEEAVCSESDASASEAEYAECDVPEAECAQAEEATVS